MFRFSNVERLLRKPYQLTLTSGFPLICPRPSSLTMTPELSLGLELSERDTCMPKHAIHMEVEYDFCIKLDPEKARW
jgi:hypothetical protein